MDYLQILLSLVGGSGLAGWILTYVQLRHQRLVEARHLFRDIVLTKDMLELLAVDYDLIALQKGTLEFGEGKRPIYVRILGGSKGKRIEIRTEKQLIELTEKVCVRANTLADQVAKSGLTMLLPERLRKQAENVRRAMEYPRAPSDTQKARQELDKLGRELKKVLGTEVLD
jgi:hypothetical protein